MLNPIPARPCNHYTLTCTAAVLLAGFLAALGGCAQERTMTKVLFITKSSGFQHSPIKRERPDELAFAEKLLVELGRSHGYEVTCTKDASLLNDPRFLDQFDVLAFYSSGDLTTVGKEDQAPAMTPQAKANMLRAIENGKGVIGFHSATDTFHSPVENKPVVRPADGGGADPFISMIGGEFTGHGSQQYATMKVVSHAFPGLEGLKDFGFVEEWYAHHFLAPDMHVILVQDTTTMKNEKGERERFYDRPPFPATWARMHGKGRVFYTSMGHREDVWTNPTFQKVAIAGLNWVAGRTQFVPTPNMEQVCPQGK
jgi:type 1 glutamine amidotransferase